MGILPFRHLNINIYLLIWFLLGIDILFASSGWNNIPIPNNLVGYRSWHSSPPSLRLEIHAKTLLRLKSGSEVVLKINAPQAYDMKLSFRPDFEGASWRKVKKEQPWILIAEDNQTVYTVYAVFRYRNQENRPIFISPIVHDSLHLREPHKKITRTATGYFDWFNLVLFVESQVTSTEGTGDFITLQRRAEELLRKVTYETVQKTPILFDLSLEDFMTLNSWLLPDLRETIFNMKFEKIYYPTQNSIFLEQSYPLLRTGTMSIQYSQPLIYHQIIQKLYPHPLPAPLSSYTDRNISSLIIDIRGVEGSDPPWTPSLLVEVADNKGNAVLTPSDVFGRGTPQTSNGFTPFVRYIRDLENTGDWKIPENPLIIKALEVDKKNNRIIILEQYGKIIRNRIQQIQNLVKGNFYLVTD